MMSDPKYLALRKKLDALKYTETLDPISCALVDRLLSDYFKISSKLDAEKKKNIYSAPKPELAPALNDKIDFLNERLQQLKAENEQLKKNCSPVTPPSPSPNPALDEKISFLNKRLQDLMSQYEEQLATYNEQSQASEQQITSLKSQLQSLTAQNGQLKSQGSKAQDQEQYLTEMAALLEKKNREIRELEENASKHRVKTAVLEKTIDELKSAAQSQHSEQSSQQSRMFELLKAELASSEKKLSAQRISLSSQQQQNQLLRSQLRKTSEQLSEYRLDETKSHDLHSVTKHSKDKLESRYEEVLRQLAEQKEENCQLQGKCDETQRNAQRLEAKLKEALCKAKTMTDHSSVLQEEITNISNKSTTFARRVRELEAINAVFEKQLKDREADSSSDRPPREESGVQQKQNLSKQVALLQRQSRALRQQAKSLKQQQHRILMQREQLGLQSKKLSHIIKQGNKNMDILRAQKQELMKSNRELHERTETVHSSDHSTKHELMRWQEKCQGTEALLEELRSTVKNEQYSNQLLETELAKLEAKLAKAEQTNKEVVEDNKTMAYQIKLLDDRKHELAAKLKQAHESTQSTQLHSLEYKKQQDLLQQQNEGLLAQLRAKEQALLVYDCQHDELQNLVDQKTDHIAELQDQLKKLERHSSQASKEASEREISTQSLQKRLANCEAAKQALEKDCTDLHEKYCQERAHSVRVEVQLKQVQNEFNLILLARNEHQKDTDRSRNKAVELERRLKDKLKEYDTEHQRATSLTIINNELGEELHRQRVESTRLKGLIAELEKENNNMYFHLTDKDQQLGQLTAAMDEAYHKEMQLVQEIGSYQRQLQNLSEDLEARQSDCQLLVRERDASRAERNFRKESLSASSASEWKLMLEARIGQLQQDYDCKKRETEHFKVRAREMEDLLAEERIKVFRLTGSINGQANEQGNGQGNGNSDGRSNGNSSNEPNSPIKAVMHESIVETVRERSYPHNDSLHSSTPDKSEQHSQNRSMLENENWNSNNHNNSQTASQQSSSSAISQNESVSSRDIRTKMQKLTENYYLETGHHNFMLKTKK